ICDHGCEHDHDHSSKAGSHHTWLDEAVDWLQGLGMKRFDRTNPAGVTEAHKLAISKDIANMLLRAYRMDPTDYGVYNGYFMFLTINEFGGGGEARGVARRLSENTIALALKETSDPQPYVTAAMAQLNLFFMDQEDFEGKGQPVPVPVLADHRQKIEFLVRRAEVLREQSIAEGRWNLVSEERKDAMKDRIGLAEAGILQFGKLMALSRKGILPIQRGESPDRPVAEALKEDR
ncbi:MAG: hypothetical protein KDL87_09930, partial [Verrucomicrobiae bacterium]|nr:hypothetical protein [Verrucomicrobiae bacterium]